MIQQIVFRHWCKNNPAVDSEDFLHRVEYHDDTGNWFGGSNVLIQYCPYCGEKLDGEKAKREQKEADERRARLRESGLAKLTDEERRALMLPVDRP